jgi:hypothetical protein
MLSTATAEGIASLGRGFDVSEKGYTNMNVPDFIKDYDIDDAFTLLSKEPRHA